MENITVIYHITYILISAVLTMWVGKTLSEKGRELLTGSFNGNDLMADSVNHLLVVGFYLINFGVVSFFLRFGDVPLNAVEFIELLSLKIGVVLLLPGIIYFVTMFNLAKLRNREVPHRYPTVSETPFSANGLIAEPVVEKTE